MGDQAIGTKSYCPVCGMELAGNPQRCRRCGWQLTSPKELWSPGREQEDAPLLEAQRKQYILGAVAAAYAAGEFNQAVFSQATQGLLGWGVRPQVLYSIRQEYEVLFSQFLNECQFCEATLQELIDSAQRARSVLVFAEANLNGVQLGVLDASRPLAEMWLHRDELTWTEYSEELPAASPERELALAVGMAPALDQLQNWLFDYVDRKLAEWQVAGSQNVCVCFNLSGWAAMDRFMQAIARPGRFVLRIPYRPAPSETFDDLIARVIKKIPQPYSLALLTAAVDPSSGVVSLVPQVIFREGVQADPTSPRRVHVHFANAQNKRGILAVVKYLDTPANYELVQSWEVDIPQNRELNLRAVLSEPGSVQISADSTIQAADLNLQMIQKETPRTLTVGLDLALIVDTLADEPAWKERLKFARELIEQFQTRLGKTHLLRVAVFAYGDREHGNMDTVRPAHLRGHGLNSAAEALNFLGKLSTTPVESNDFEAALEDALQAVQGMRWGPNRQCLVVTIGQRPPHPRTARYANQMINLNLDWEGLVQSLKTGLKARSWVVRCPLIWPAAAPLHEDARHYADLFWKTWGYSGLFDLGPKVTPADVVQAILNVPQQDQPLRIPLQANAMVD